MSVPSRNTGERATSRTPPPVRRRRRTTHVVAPSDSDESRTHSPRGEPSEASGGPKGPPTPMPVSAKGSPPSAAVAGRGAPSGPPPPTPASNMEPPSLGVNPSNGGAVLSATVGEGGVTPPKGGVTPPTMAPTSQDGNGVCCSPRHGGSEHYHNRGRSEPGQFVEP